MMTNERKNMSWNLEGKTVEGQYIGSIQIRGKVELSRVKYGGKPTHHIVLDTPIVVFGQQRDRVSLDHDQVQQIID